MTVVFVHTTEGRPIAFHVLVDRIFATGNGPVELVRSDGERFKLKESKAEIEKYIRDAESLTF